MPDAGDREETYAEAGSFVVDRCDALVAIWDGAPSRGVGGTADAVARARDREVPLYWIRAGDAGYEVVEDVGKGPPRARFKQADEYNRAPVATGDQVARVDLETSRLCAEAEHAGLAAELVEPALRWYLPFLARADVLSLHLQRRYYGLGMALFVLAALAAVAGAASSVLEPLHWLTFLQVLLLLVLLGLTVDARRRQLPTRWISCRLIAEQLRAAMFLTIAGLETSRDRADLVDPSLGWVQAASAEVCLRSPRRAPPAAAASGLRRFLLGAWVDEQLGYLRRTGDRQRRRDRLLGTAVWWLFVGSLGLIVVKAFSGGERAGCGPGPCLDRAAGARQRVQRHPGATPVRPQLGTLPAGRGSPGAAALPAAGRTGPRGPSRSWRRPPPSCSARRTRTGSGSWGPGTSSRRRDLRPQPGDSLPSPSNG